MHFFLRNAGPAVEDSMRTRKMKHEGVSSLDFGRSEVEGKRLPSFLPQDHPRSSTAESANVTSPATLFLARDNSRSDSTSSNYTSTVTEDTATVLTSTTAPSTSSAAYMASANTNANRLPPHKWAKYKNQIAATQAARSKPSDNSQAPAPGNPAVDSVANQKIRDKLETKFSVTVSAPARGKPVKGNLVPYSASSKDSSQEPRPLTLPPHLWLKAGFREGKEGKADKRAENNGALAKALDGEDEDVSRNGRAHGQSTKSSSTQRRRHRRGESAALGKNIHSDSTAQQSKHSSTQVPSDCPIPGFVADANTSTACERNIAQEQTVARSKQTKVTDPRSWLEINQKYLIKAGTNAFPQAPPPNPHPVAYSTSDADSLENSGRASSGWGTRQKRADEKAWFHAEKTDENLRDWDGGMAPPPVDWDNRPGFKDEYSREKIHEWNVDVSKKLLEVQHADMMAKVDGLAFDIQGEAAPRYWKPSGNNQAFADKIWLEATTTQFLPIDTYDLDNAKPWWQYYHSKASSFLMQKHAPSISGIDPDETETDRLARENDKGGIHVVENRQNAARAKRDAQRARLLKKQERIRQLSQTLPTHVEKPKIHPTIPRLFLRSATLADMPAVKDLYNHYVDHAVLVPETSRLETSELELRFRASKDANLPFLLACQRGEVIKARGKRNLKYLDGQDLVLPDKVVGFAFADDWNDMKGMCCHTACLELYVDPEFQARGIGSALLDRIMSLLDPVYLEKGGYETVGEDLDGVGPSRLIKNTVVQYYYDAAKPEKLMWISQWLAKWLGFRKTGDLEGVGLKFEKSINLAFLQKTTGAKLD